MSNGVCWFWVTNVCLLWIEHGHPLRAMNTMIIRWMHTHTHTRAEYLPDIERLAQQREKQFKKKMLAELPRRTSDRIAIKAAQKIEEVSQWHDGRIHVGVTGRKPTSHVSTAFWLLFDLFSLLHCNSIRELKFNFHGSTLLCGSYTNKRSNLINPI